MTEGRNVDVIVEPVRHGSPASAGEPALEVANLRKVFGGVVALADASILVNQGEIHGLLGENGAGKSTLVHILAGVETADSGSVRLFGEPMHLPLTPAAVRHAGVAFIYQRLGLVQDMTVAENFSLVAGYQLRGRMIDRPATDARCRAALAWLGVDLDPGELISALPLATQTLVAIARALAMDARLLVLDEPTASLPARDVDLLFGILRRLRNEGVAMILISHRLDEVRSICDRVTVLRDGRVAVTAPCDQLSTSELVGHILGRDATGTEPVEAEVTIGGTPSLVVSDLAGAGAGPVSFDLHQGEVLGLTGVVGAGHAAVGRLLFGCEQRTGGSIRLHDSDYSPRTPDQAVAAGAAFVPSDREAEGAAVQLTVLENLFMNPTGEGSLWSGPRRELAQCRRILEEFDVRPRDPNAEFSTLSGGNAQKVVLARWMSCPIRLLILEEPTIGVDVGARQEIHERLRQIALDGTPVLVISSDFQEIEQVCDRVLVMSQGRVVATLAGELLRARRIALAAHTATGGL